MLKGAKTLTVGLKGAKTLTVALQGAKTLMDLLKMLKDRTCELQSLKNRREEISHLCSCSREEMDRRTLLLLYMDEGLMDALMKLDAVKKEQQKLDQQIHELTTRFGHTARSKVSLSQLQKQEATLLEEENQLKLQRENLKKALEDAQKNTQKGDALYRRSVFTVGHLHCMY
uniref:Uncharacterized protein n=1 Tax=Pygocentrus nattereri TaxID=42514 RepID=A0AAR2KJN5_PYGNA